MPNIRIQDMYKNSYTKTKQNPSYTITAPLQTIDATNISTEYDNPNA